MDINNLEKKVDALKRSEERIVDLLERIGGAFLYTKTDMGQTDIAKVLGVGNDRISKILKGIKKSN